MAYVQQILFCATHLLFGLLAVMVWRRLGPVRRDRSALAWALTATNFLVVGSYAGAQSLLSAVARSIGKDSALYGFVSTWSPAANLARGAVSVVFAAMLLALMVSRRRRAARGVAAAPAILGLTALVSTLVLHRLLPFRGAHAFLSDLAVISAITAVVLMAALFAAIHHDALDQLLWLALAVYTLKETMSVSFMAVMAAWTMTYAATYWSVFFWVGTVMGAIMIGFAARRLQLASGGRRVPPAFEAVHALRRPAHG